MRLWSGRPPSPSGRPVVPSEHRHAEHRKKQWRCRRSVGARPLTWNCCTEVPHCCSLGRHSHQKPCSPPSAHGPPSSVPFPISTTGALGPSLLIPLHQLTALHSPLSKLHPSSAWAPELFPQATASQGPFRRERGASLPHQGVCYCCGPEMGETNAGRLTWNIFS